MKKIFYEKKVNKPRKSQRENNIGELIDLLLNYSRNNNNIAYPSIAEIIYETSLSYYPRKYYSDKIKLIKSRMRKEDILKAEKSANKVIFKIIVENAKISRHASRDVNEIKSKWLARKISRNLKDKNKNKRVKI